MSCAKASRMSVHSLYNTKSGISANPYIQHKPLSLIRISTIRNKPYKLLPYLKAFSEFPYLTYCPDLGVWLKTGYGLVNGFTDHLYTPLRTTSNYSAIANLHTLQFTTAPVKSFKACCVFISRSVATDSNGWNSSASHAQVLSSQPPMQNSTLNWQLTGSPQLSSL
jgi:hypothetical protein